MLVLLPFLKMERLELVEMLLRKIQKRRRMTAQKRRKG